jgi:signal transduction histidine kinase
VIDVLAQAMQLAVADRCLLAVATFVARVATTGARVATFLLASSIALAVLALPMQAAEPDIRILILNATDPYLPAYQVIDAAMRERLAREATRHFAFFSETLDGQRFDWKQYEAEFLALLAKKYRGLRVDVVVPITQPALDFANTHGKELWPDAGIVFHGIPAPALENIALPSRVTGVTTGEDVASTLDLAWRLQPNARRILVIAGVAELDQRLVDDTRRALAGRTQTAEVEFLLGLPQTELMERIKQEAAGTIVLYLTEFRDRDGRPYTPREFLRAISAVSPAPIYGLYETYGGYGMAAGAVEFYQDRGRLVAERVLQMVSAEATPGIAAVPSRCMADARELRRWSLDEGRLPDGCEIRFAERPFWREYPLQTFGALAVVLLQAALIVFLLVERGRRRVAELELHRRLLEVVHLNRTAAAGVLSASVAHELTQPLGAIQSYAEAAEVYLKADPSNVGRIEAILAAIRRDDERAVDIIRRLRGLFKKRTEIEAQDFDLNDALGAALDILGPEATKRGVELSVNRSQLALPVHADQMQLQQVILNLALNAMDALQDCASGQRRMTIQSALVEKSWVEVLVSDSGSGIADDMLAKVFEPFYSTKPQGTGLGLSISRAIVEGYRGKIWAENRPSGGATFRFTLPVAKEATP